MYTIKQASRLTGVSEASLRTWERRYAVVVPHRNESGYRVYDEQDLAAVSTMRRLVDDGWSPAEAADAVRSGTVPAVLDDVVGPETSDGLQQPSAATYRQRFLSSAAQMDTAGIEESLDGGFALGSFEHVVDSWLFPALERVEVETTDEHCGATQQRGGGGWQQVVAPRDGVPDGLLLAGRSRRPPLSSPSRLSGWPRTCSRVRRLHARRGELAGQRRVVQPRADLPDVVGTGRGQVEGRPRRAGSLGEPLHRRVRWQQLEGVLVLGGDVERARLVTIAFTRRAPTSRVARSPAADATCSKLSRTSRTARSLSSTDHVVDRRDTRRAGQVDRHRDDVGDLRLGSGRGEVDEDQSVAERVAQALRHGDSQPRLAAATGSGDRHRLHRESLRSRSEPVFSSRATHSTWLVIGNRSKARRSASRYPRSAKNATSRARAAGSQAT